VSDRLDTGSLPLTEPHAAPIFDTGPHPQPMTPREGTEPQPVVNDNPWFDPIFGSVDPDPPASSDETDVLVAEREVAEREVAEREVAEREAEPPAAPAHPVAVPGQYQYLKIWKFLTVLCGTWLVSGAVGLGLYYWWFHSTDKTWIEVTVLLYVLVCGLGASLLSLAENKPMLSGTAIAVLTAPFASGVGAAALYGAIAFGWVSP
jgi:hypothetical protein